MIGCWVSCCCGLFRFSRGWPASMWMVVFNTSLPLIGPLAPLDSYRNFEFGTEDESWSFALNPLLINRINLKRDGVRICLGKDVRRCIFEGLLTPSCFRDGIIYIEIFMWNMARSSGVGGVEMHWWMLRGWCCIAVATLEPMNRDSRCRMSALRFHFWGRKVAWNQASLVRASSVRDLYVSCWINKT